MRQPTQAAITTAQYNAARYGLDLSMPCTKCGYPMKRCIVGHNHLGPIRRYRCEWCDSVCPECMRRNVNCECKAVMQLDMFG